MNWISYKTMTHKEQKSLEGFKGVPIPPTPKPIKGGTINKCATRNCKGDPQINNQGRWLCERCWQKYCKEE